jgi:hypothetical protein
MRRAVRTEVLELQQDVATTGEVLRCVRAFLYEIIQQVTELKERVDQSLNGLERLDLIRTRSLQPELEYIFKHALTQEVVYNGLLKKERQEIHERIAVAIIISEMLRIFQIVFCLTGSWQRR